MSIPTINNPSSSATNDPSIVEQNDRSIAQSVVTLENSTNVDAYKGIRVIGGGGFLTRDGNHGGNWDVVFDSKLSESFMIFKLEPVNTYSYIDINAYAQRGSASGLPSETQPATITIQLQRSNGITPAALWVDVGSAITLSSGSLLTYTTVDLSAVVRDNAYPWHRVKVTCSDNTTGGDDSWKAHPVFVGVNVRFKADSAE